MSRWRREMAVGVATVLAGTVLLPAVASAAPVVVVVRLTVTPPTLPAAGGQVTAVAVTKGAKRDSFVAFLSTAPAGQPAPIHGVFAVKHNKCAVTLTFPANTTGAVESWIVAVQGRGPGVKPGAKAALKLKVLTEAA